MSRVSRVVNVLAGVVAFVAVAGDRLVAAQQPQPATTAAGARDDVRIAYVDLQRAIFASNPGKEARRSLDERTDRLKKDLEKRQEEVRALQAEFQKQSALLSSEARADRERDLQRRFRDVERLKQDSEDELNRRDAELSKRILGEVREVVRQLGGKGNYTLILERNAAGVLYAANGVDLTEEVIKVYNASKSGK
jgi:outer membrane protein